eukprot:3225071-Ditylum_brightwellii.AAC.1
MAINKVEITKMMMNLKENDIDDYNRRMHQAAVLNHEPVLISSTTIWDRLSPSPPTISLPQEIILSLKNGIKVLFSEQQKIDGFGHFAYSAASLKGYYPDDSQKKNQDMFDAKIDIAGIQGHHLFSVYDGHGPDGHHVSQSAKTM